MFEKIKKMTFKDYIGLVNITLSFIPGMILRLVKKNIWLISEKKSVAKDNGYYFFKYVTENNLHKNTYYVIDKKSQDYINKLSMYKNIIQFESFKHHVYTWACSKNISSEVGAGFPNGKIVFNMYMWGIYRFKNVFLQHGITQNRVDCFKYENSKIRLFCCACEKEKNFVINELGYPENNVKCIGFCRYDYLFDNSLNYNYIMFMPTWRSNLVTDDLSKIQSYRGEFVESDYFKNINGLINDERIIKFLDEKNMKIILKLHDNMQVYEDLFKSKSENVIISIKSDFDIQELMKNSKYLITDYSSIAFDFAYMKKPLQYFQFDYSEFRNSHLKEGYFNYDIDGFGKVTSNIDECMEDLLDTYKNNFEMKNEYVDKVKIFFGHTDTDNCSRTYYEVNNI